jgi:hypothetical protein
MDLTKAIFRSIAFLLGVAATCGVGVGAYREYCGGPTGVAPLFLIAIAMMAGVLLLISQWREFVRGPSMVPAAVFAVCTFFYCMALPNLIGVNSTPPGSGWFTVTLKAMGYMAFSCLFIVPAAFVYHGTRSFLSSLGKALARKTRIP